MSNVYMIEMMSQSDFSDMWSVANLSLLDACRTFFFIFRKSNCQKLEAKSTRQNEIDIFALFRWILVK